jgi:conjugal transfer/type IV secretion protein DotA/TraY
VTPASTLASQLLDSAICLESIKNIAQGTATDDNTPPNPIVPSNFINEYGTVIGIYQTTPTRNPTGNSTNNGNVSYKAYLNIGAKNPAEQGATGNVYSTMCGSYQITSSVNSSELSALGLSGTALDTATDQAALNALNAKVLALSTMISTLKPIATKLANEQIAPKTGSRLADGITPIPSGYMVSAINAYISIVGDIIKPASPVSSAVQNVVDEGNAAGWIVAGSFYFVLNASQQQSLFSTASVAPTAQPYAGGGTSDLTVPQCPAGNNLGKCGDGTKPDSFYSDTTNGPNTLGGIQDYISTTPEVAYIAKRLLDGDVYARNDNTNPNNINLNSLSAIGSNGAAVVAPLQNMVANEMQWLANQMAGGDGDPLLGIASFGSRLMLSVEITWMVLAWASILLSTVAGVCASTSPGFMMFVAIVTTILPVVLGFLGVLWTCGATLAVYVPMVPYMIYSVTAIGWFLLVIEAIIAAPIVSLGLVIPSGDELGKIVPGLMLLVGIVLRPVLMIFGFILAARLFRAVISLINFGMADTFKTISATGSLFEPIAAISLYGGFVVALVNKSFALIYIVPDKIMRWIGGSAETTDAGAVHEAKQTFDKGAQTAKSMGEAPSTAGSAAAQKKVDNDAKAAMGGGDGSTPPAPPTPAKVGGAAAGAAGGSKGAAGGAAV